MLSLSPTLFVGLICLFASVSSFRERRVLRRWLLAVGCLLVAWNLPWQGMALAELATVKLVIAALACVGLLLRSYRVGWTRNRRRWLMALGGLALIALLNYTNYFAFHGHGTRAFVHLHDVAHNYLGAKYRSELGYSDLYTAVLRAEAELTGDRFRSIEVRDLSTYDLVHIRTLLQRSDSVKESFSSDRWADFKTEVRLFRERLTQEQWARFLNDHGFNATPVWSLVAGFLANQVPAGSGRGLLLLALLDPVLLLLGFGVVWRTFGTETMLLALIYFCVLFGAGFSWIGGSLLRFDWFVLFVLGLCALHARRGALAGCAFAAATALRIFPLLLILPLLGKILCQYFLRWRRGEGLGLSTVRPSTIHARFLVGLAVGGVVLGLLSIAFPANPGISEGLFGGRIGQWADFRDNMERHVKNIAPNIIGLTEAITTNRSSPTEVSVEEFDQMRRDRANVYRWQRLLGALPALLLLTFVARRRTDLGSVALGLLFLYVAVSSAAYYYLVLVVLILVHRKYPQRLAMIFAVEVFSYLAYLLESRDALVYVDRGLAVFALLVFLETARLANRDSSSDDDSSEAVEPVAGAQQ